ncbi:SAST synthase, partial [Anseranas semipalmata]|nr:SAST synthase [Anseranas semipalmata]
LFFSPGMEKVIFRPYKRPDAIWRLICFHWAGGGTSYFAQWGKLFSSSIEVSSVRLPGRECRGQEPFAKDMTEIVNEITSVLLKDLQEKPFAFFGHSFGSYVSCALAVHLKENYGLEPIHLFISGTIAPNSEPYLQIKKIDDMEDKEILDRISVLGGIPPELLQNENNRKHFMLTLKGDLKALQTYFCEEEKRNNILSCDITCFNGSEDTIHDSEVWHPITSGDTSIYNLPGGHFYLLEPSNEMLLIKHITKCIENADL